MSFDDRQARLDAFHARRKRFERALGQLQELGNPPAWDLRRLNAGTHWQLLSAGFIVNFWPSTDKVVAQGKRAAEWILLSSSLELQQAAARGVTGYRRVFEICKALAGVPPASGSHAVI